LSDFQHVILGRIADSRASLSEAHRTGDDYLVEIRLGELESLARLAAEHGVDVDGIEESFAAHGLATPALGVPLVVDLRENLEMVDEARRPDRWPAVAAGCLSD
jgi:hypothetical protein